MSPGYRLKFYYFVGCRLKFSTCVGCRSIPANFFVASRQFFLVLSVVSNIFWPSVASRLIPFTRFYTNHIKMLNYTIYTGEYRRIQENTGEYKGIEENTKEYRRIQGNTVEYRGIKGNKGESRRIQGIQENSQGNIRELWSSSRYTLITLLKVHTLFCADLRGNSDTLIPSH